MELQKVKSPHQLDGLKVIEDYKEMVETLENGEAIAHWERGDSMSPLLVDGQYVRLTPIYQIVTEAKLNADNGDIVFCKVNGEWMCHMVWVSNKASGKCLIGSTSGDLYGWTEDILAIGKPMPYIEDV